MFIKRTSLKQIRIVYYVYFLLFFPGNLKITDFIYVYSWLLFYAFAWKWYRVVRYCVLAYCLCYFFAYFRYNTPHA